MDVIDLSGDVIDLTESPVALGPRRGARAPPRAAGGGAGGSRSGRSAPASEAQSAAAAAAAGRTGTSAASAAAAAAAAAAGMPSRPAGGRRGRKRKAEGGEEAVAEQPKKSKPKKEKRQTVAGVTVSWRSKPSKAVQERMARAMPGGHRLFLIDRKVLRPVGAEGGACELFDVLGATGNVYTVTIGKQPSCTCPDSCKGNLCKHTLFVLLRVLNLPQTEPLVWQHALLADEVDQVLGGMKSASRSVGGGDILASDAVRQQLRRMSGGGTAAAGAAAAAGGAADRQREVCGDCPICFDSLEGAGEAISFCLSCGNNVHKSCIGRWVASKRASGATITCPLCRAPWRDGAAPPGSQDGGESGGGERQYINLAAYSTAHQGQDLSLERLYGDRALWIHAHQGDISRREAASMWRTMGY